MLHHSISTFTRYITETRALTVLVMFLLFSTPIQAQILTSDCQSVSNFNFLDDLVPTSADPTLTVNLNFVVFKPAGSTGVFDNVTYADALNLVASLNYYYEYIDPADNPVPNVPYVTNTKIAFTLKTFSVITSTSMYNDVRTATLSAPAWYDPTAISVFFGGCAWWGCRPRTTSVPADFILFPAPASPTPTFTLMGPDLAHEVGHCLGLQHTAIGEPSSVSPPGACCANIYANDMVMLPSGIFYGSVSSAYYPAPCGYPGSLTNNIMGYNWNCRRNFSPRQMGIMHYCLRTSMLRVLTTQSQLDATLVNHAFDYTVTGNETWVADRYMKGDIIIEPGASLTTGCLVAMTKHGKISVKKKGKFTLSTGVLTNISNLLWDGVQVEGDVTKPQVIAGNGFSTEQGLANFWGGTVSNAVEGVRSNLTDINRNTIWSSTGGIIRASSTQFLNNVRDVDIHTYQLYPTISSFYVCEFKTAGQLNEAAQPKDRIYLCNVFGVEVKACNFEYAAGNTYVFGQRGKGINSQDATYLVDQYSGTPCQFTNFTRGIYAINTITTRVATIRNSRFIENDKDGVYLHNMDYAVFDNNYLKMSSTQPAGNGLYLNECQNYTVKNNTFEGTGSWGIGMYVNMSAAGAHQVYRNTFSDLYLGIGAQNNNSGLTNVIDGLRMNCNDFSQSSNQYDIMVNGTGTGTNSPTVMKTQGVIGPLANVNTVVRNKYGASCWNQNKWYTSWNSTKVVDHGTSNDAICKPLPQPACSNSAIVNVVAITSTLNPSHCPAYLPSGGGDPNTKAAKLVNINSYLAALKSTTTPDFFELKATMAAKLEWYMSDTLHGAKDSVIAILNANPGNIDDADVQVVVAYLDKGDYSQASSHANALSSSRADWRALLLKLVDIYQEPNHIYSVATNTAYKSFLEGYANTDGKDGQAAAQAILQFVCGIDFAEPRLLPDEGSGSRTAHNATAELTKNTDAVPAILVFPNPAQQGVTVLYNSEDEAAVLLEVKDLLGRTIYANFINGSKEEYVSLLGYSTGIYVVNVSRNKELLYTTKLVKQE